MSDSQVLPGASWRTEGPTRRPPRAAPAAAHAATGPVDAALEEQLAILGVPAPTHSQANGRRSERRRRPSPGPPALDEGMDSELNLPAGINLEEAR